jgi:hypothetical protein
MAILRAEWYRPQKQAETVAEAEESKGAVAQSQVGSRETW